MIFTIWLMWECGWYGQLIDVNSGVNTTTDSYCGNANLPWTILPTISTQRVPKQINEPFQPHKSPLKSNKTNKKRLYTDQINFIDSVGCQEYIEMVWSKLIPHLGRIWGSAFLLRCVSTDQQQTNEDSWWIETVCWSVELGDGSEKRKITSEVTRLKDR